MEVQREFAWEVVIIVDAPPPKKEELCFFFFLASDDAAPPGKMKLELVGAWKLDEAPEKEIEDLFEGLL